MVQKEDEKGLRIRKKSIEICNFNDYKTQIEKNRIFQNAKKLAQKTGKKEIFIPLRECLNEKEKTKRDSFLKEKCEIYMDSLGRGSAHLFL